MTMAVRSDIASIPRWADSFSYRGQRCELVVDPMVRSLTDGDTVFGWGGDNRLALYASIELGMWVLMRYDEDRQIRVVTMKPMADVPTASIVGVLLLHLLAHDTRRVNMVEITSLANRRREEQVGENLQAWAEEEGGPRLAHDMLREMDRTSGQSTQVIPKAS